MNPETNHRKVSIVRALILPAVAALGWLVLGAASAQADTGVNPSSPPAASTVITTAQAWPAVAAAALPPVVQLPPAGLAGVAPTMPSLGAAAGAGIGPTATAAGSAVAAAENFTVTALSRTSVVVPQVPELPTLPPSSAVLPDPGPVADEVPVTVQLSDAVPVVSVGSLPAVQGAPATALPASASSLPTMPETREQTIMVRPSRTDVSGSPFPVSGWTAGPGLSGNGSGQPGPHPQTPALLSGLSAAPGTGSGGAPQPAAEPACHGLTHGSAGSGPILRDGWDLPENPAFPPGSSPD